MAQLPEQVFLDSLHEIIKIDRDWIPQTEDGSLYLRPFMYASRGLPRREAGRREYLYVLIASPAGAYFKGGVKPITVWISEDYTRAAPGGTGAAKCGGNYAASLVAQAEAIENDCDQVIFLDAVERRYVDELGGMNVFFVFDDGTMVTPPLNGSILPGITRDAIITLAAERGIKTDERPYSMDEWRADAASGRLTEAFACGTAAVITPIGAVRSRQEHFTIGAGHRSHRAGHDRHPHRTRRHPARSQGRPARLGAPGHLIRHQGRVRDTSDASRLLSRWFHQVGRCFRSADVRGRLPNVTYSVLAIIE